MLATLHGFRAMFSGHRTVVQTELGAGHRDRAATHTAVKQGGTERMLGHVGTVADEAGERQRPRVSARVRARGAGP
jgi:hypothetical protein